MNVYCIAGIPYSDELYHHGTKGMKWGRRLYQNEDGSLTSLGRVHYGVGKAVKGTGKAVGKAAKAVGTGAVKRIKQRHPSLMSDDELKAYANRKWMEADLQKAKEDIRNRTLGKRIAGEVLERVAVTAATKLTEGAINTYFENKRRENQEEFEEEKRLKKEAREEEERKNKASYKIEEELRTRGADMSDDERDSYMRKLHDLRYAEGKESKYSAQAFAKDTMDKAKEKRDAEQRKREKEEAEAERKAKEDKVDKEIDDNVRETEERNDREKSEREERSRQERNNYYDDDYSANQTKSNGHQRAKEKRQFAEATRKQDYYQSAANYIDNMFKNLGMDNVDPAVRAKYIKKARKALAAGVVTSDDGFTWNL